jgi:ABC-type transporter Mla MlaB component
MAGTHTPDSVRCKHSGSAWLLDFEDSHLKQYRRLSPGQIQFVRLYRSLHDLNDISELRKMCDSLDPRTVILDLKLSGQLSTDEQNELHKSIETVQNKFQACTVDLDIRNKIDSSTIAILYPQGTLAERLLSTLLADNQHPNDATLAHDLIQEISNS